MSTATAPAPEADGLAAPPHNAEAERTVLGAILVEPTAMESVGWLRPGDFYREAHRHIYAAMIRVTECGLEVDAVTVKEQLARAKALEEAGGVAYLARLMDGLPRISNVSAWGRIIREHAQRRQIITLSHKLAEAAREGEDPQDLVERADKALLQIAARGTESRGPRPNKEVVDEALDNIALRMNAEYGIVGYRTGLPKLDHILQGIRPGRMGVIGARLGNGKSMLAMNVADAICEQAPGKAVAFFSLEMDDTELNERRLAAKAKVNPNALWHAGAKKDERFARLTLEAQHLYTSNLRIIEDAWTVREIAQQCRDIRNAEGLAAVFVDYVQLMRGEKRAEKRYLEIADISVSLRKLAKDLDVPLVVVAQLNREAATKGGKHRPPTMEDLAESDNLGRDCHWCVLIDPEPPPLAQNAGFADLYVRKNRGGRKGECRVKYRANYSLFLDEEAEETGE